MADQRNVAEGSTQFGCCTDVDICVLCGELLNNGKATSRLSEKGSIGINNASVLRRENTETREGQYIHQECRRKHINKFNIAASNKRRITEHEDTDQENEKRTLRSKEKEFSFKNDCIFCGESVKTDWKTYRSNVIPVRTEKKFQESIKKICLRRSDDWSTKVLSRIEYAGDCFAMDAVYHNTCSVNFRTNRNVPLAVDIHAPTPPKKPRQGRPEDQVKHAAFIQVADYFEANDDEQVTLTDLVTQMASYLHADEEPYSVKYMKRKLCEHFGDKIIIAEADGKPDVVTFRHNASSILYDFYKAPKKLDADVEKMRLVKATADLLKCDIKSMSGNHHTYPSIDDIKSTDKHLDYLPPSLRLLLTDLFPGNSSEIKVASIGQAIMQATRPRSLLSPLQIGLGVQMHHHFASRFLIDSLHQHGFCSSYTEVKRFEANAASAGTPDVSQPATGSSLQFVADNIDHNVRTLDGNNTFHGMGIISTATPGRVVIKPIPRGNPSIKDIEAVGRIGMHFYKSEWNGLASMVYEELSTCNREDCSDPTSALDVLWKIMWPLKSPRPSWSGYMQTVHRGDHPGTSTVTFLPMIDMNPGDMSCIYSTLLYVGAQARQQNVAPVITFDQPLWWKATTIVSSAPLDKDLQSTVLRLGSFHTEMSFLGCIGHLMSGSGLHEVLETIYAPNAVSHMMTGKAVSRAIRGHLLVDTALNALLVGQAFEYPWICKHDEEIDAEDTHQSRWCSRKEVSNEDLKHAVDVFEELVGGQLSIEDVCQDSVLMKVKMFLDEYKTQLKDKRTSQLWLQYTEMIEILRRFIKAERTGNWDLHLESLREMIPYFAASGHSLYAKSARLYLQKMLALQKTHEEVYKDFKKGLHVVRRSDRLWAGLPTDLVIEQMLMRSIKTNGGLTRGKGIGEIQRLTWVLSMPACASINVAMQTFTGISYNTSEQHKDASQARMDRDHKDILTVLCFLEERNPFTDDPSLRNIATGETADKPVNVEKAKFVGQTILDKMTGVTVQDYAFKKKDQVCTLASKSAVQFDGDAVHVDPKLLFQRLVTSARNMGENLTSVFSFELCSSPPALFEPSGLPLIANKASLADTLWTRLQNPDWQPPVDTPQLEYVLDGGALLHRVVWPRGCTYNTIIQLYTEYVHNRYGTPTIVFDGYEAGPTTKDIAHLRRGDVGVEVKCEKNLLLKSKKENFLANQSNKQRFINLLGTALEEQGCRVKYARSDADLDIVMTAVELAKEHTTVVIGEDTDLLVLLCYHASCESSEIYYMSETKSNTKKKRKVWQIKETKRRLGEDICSNILFIHAFTGCDTTSRVFGIGKSYAVKEMVSDISFRQQASVFSVAAEKEDIINAGESVFVTLFNGGTDITLDKLRHVRFCEKVAACSTFVEPKQLPPTAAAAKYHSMRVYYQVQEWMGHKPADMLPEKWGWELRSGRLYPTLTDQPAAPKHLLRIIRCNCKTDCGSARCSCRKHGLECSPGCGECRGVSCSNSMHVEDDI